MLVIVESPRTFPQLPRRLITQNPMHLPSLAVTLSGLAALVQVHAGMYGAPVVELDAKSFKDVMGNEHASMVAFVAPW